MKLHEFIQALIRPHDLVMITDYVRMTMTPGVFLRVEQGRPVVWYHDHEVCLSWEMLTQLQVRDQASPQQFRLRRMLGLPGKFEVTFDGPNTHNERGMI